MSARVCVCLSLTLFVPTLRLMKLLLSSTLRNNIIVLAFLGFKLVDYGGGKFHFGSYGIKIPQLC